MDGENKNARLKILIRLVRGLSEYPLNQLHLNNYSESFAFDVDLNIEGTRIHATEIGDYIVRVAVDVINLRNSNEL